MSNVYFCKESYWRSLLNARAVLKKIIIGREAKKPLHYVSKAIVIQGKGIEGDRYFYAEGTFNKPQLSQSVREISLIDYATLDICNERIEAKLDFLDLRRNLVIENIELKELIGKEFSIGRAKFIGLRVAPPCRYLSRLLGLDMMTALKYIGGLRASVIESGEIEVGDLLTV